MPEPSAYALVCDLLGDEPDAPERPGVEDAVRGCARGEVVAASGGGEDVAVAVLGDGRAFVVPDACPHGGGPLSDGFVDGGRLVCPRHGWEFDLDTGTCPSRPRVRLRAERADS